MKLLIDTLPLLADYTGIRRYTEDILTRLINYNSIEKVFDIKYYYNFPSSNLLKNNITNENNNSLLNVARNLIKKNFFIKKTAIKAGSLLTNCISGYPDIFWEPNNMPYQGIKSKKTITTLHDFSFIHYPECHPKSRIKMYKHFFNSCIKKSDVIITGSYFTKSEIIKILKYNPDKIKVIYHGIDHNIFKIYPNYIIDEFKKNNNFLKKFLLYVGSIEPRKNLLNLLKAYNLTSKEYKEEFNLVIASTSGWNNEEIYKLIENNKKYIHEINFLSNINLALLYNSATVLIYSSFYEGFGLPPLESQACGTPVIISNRASLPEIYGNSSIVIDPLSVEDIKNAILSLTTNDCLHKKYSLKGIENASNFSWESSAKKHFELFKNI